jgi:hypothetical protein
MDRQQHTELMQLLFGIGCVLFLGVVALFLIMLNTSSLHYGIPPYHK